MTVGGYTPLHYAVMMMAEEVVKILIRANANVDAVSHCGWTPLHLAAFKGHKGIFLHLLANGANKHARIRGGIHLSFSLLYISSLIIIKRIHWFTWWF